MLTEQLASQEHIPLPSREHTATKKQEGTSAVSSITAAGFAHNFFTAMVWDSLACSPGTLQPQVVLFTRGFAAPSRGAKGFLVILFLRLQLITNQATYLQNL